MIEYFYDLNAKKCFNLEIGSDYHNFVVRFGAVAKRLGSGLQNRERRFKSGRHLIKILNILLLIKIDCGFKLFKADN